MNTENSILENLKFAREIIAAYPESKIDLEHYKVDTDCGTLFCGYGILSTIPRFRAQGIMLDDLHPYPSDKGSAYPSDVSNLSDLDSIFGYLAFDRIFDGANTHFDKFLFPNAEYKSHKELLLARLDRQIREYSNEEFPV